jgi:Animal haem peroxidase
MLYRTRFNSLPLTCVRVLLALSVSHSDTLVVYKDLPHPVSGYLRLPPSAPATPPPSLPYVFRPSNGSHYNPLYPAMGMAGTPYARTVPSRHTLPKDSLPDPDLVFDTLLKRDKFVPHPGGMSALFFAFADLVIHSIFKTNRSDWSINDASSYLDLSVLYGHNDADVEAIRRKDGSGQLWNDVFADSRLTHMPPASCALLVLMSRNHNVRTASLCASTATDIPCSTSLRRFWTSTRMASIRSLRHLRRSRSRRKILRSSIAPASLTVVTSCISFSEVCEVLLALTTCADLWERQTTLVPSLALSAIEVIGVSTP